MNIILLGFMGSGKSFIGKELSSQINYILIDSDCKIEKKNNLSISDIFKKFGEDYFRSEEKKLINNILLEDRIILSTGGSMFCNNQNIRKLKKFGLTIYLKYSNEILYERLKKEKVNRPLIKHLDDPDLKTFIISNLKKREVFYYKANNIIECDNLDKDEILRKINAIVFPK